MVETRTAAPLTSEIHVEHSWLHQVCANKLGPYMTGPIYRGRRWSGDSDAFRARWEGFVFGEDDGSGNIRRAARVSQDHGAYPSPTGVDRGVWSIRFLSDPNVTVEQSLERALDEGGSVIRDYSDERNQSNVVTLLNDGTGFLYEYRLVDSGIPFTRGPKKGKEFLGYGSPLSMELSTKLAEEVAAFSLVQK